MDEAITKRIHISGLTPAITAKDLSDRLSSFGTVKSIDGFGKLDAVGQPRKYAYATLETTKGKLARCMNLLSGVTWKGAKLRLGDAKPDFRERIAQEKAALKRAAEEGGEPSRKRRRLRGVQGVHARDMSLVTPENVSTRGGWRVTPTGRLIRPMRMRPSHPLPEPLDIAKSVKAKGKEKATGKSRKRVHDPPTRARRKTIDPTKWGSQHLKGIFLENAAAYIPTSIPPPRPIGDAQVAKIQHEASGSSESESESEEDVSEDEDSSEEVPPPLPAKTSAQDKPVVVKASEPASSVIHELAEEKNQSLNLLQSLFGDKEDWGGAESLDSDMEEDAPADTVPPQTRAIAEESGSEEDEDGGGMEVDDAPTKDPSPAPAPPADRAKAKLKDLFAPREEEAGFSLLGHLDLDLELDDDIPFEVPIAPSVAPTALARPLAPVQPLVPLQQPHGVSLDPSRPFFFPSESAGMKGRVLDPTDWKTWFYRTDTPEAIRARWGETKGELTAGWKRRHREAVKSRRRRGGGGGEAE